jgi:hypothetical protein
MPSFSADQLKRSRDLCVLFTQQLAPDNVGEFVSRFALPFDLEFGAHSAWAFGPLIDQRGPRCSVPVGAHSQLLLKTCKNALVLGLWCVVLFGVCGGR